MTQFVVLSDVHANHLLHCVGKKDGIAVYDKYLSKIENKSEKVLLCAGDISNDIPGWHFANEQIFSLFKHVFVTFGNHDLASNNKTTENKIDELKKLISTWKNVTLLDGDVVEYEGIKIGGCLGWYDELDDEDPTEAWEWRNYWYDGRIWCWHNQNLPTIAYENVSKMKKVLDQKPDIFITHVAHEKCNTNPKYVGSDCNKYFYYTANEYDLTGVKKVICGHTHDCVKTSQDNYEILCNPFGYISEENPEALHNLTVADFEFTM